MPTMLPRERGEGRSVEIVDAKSFVVEVMEGKAVKVCKSTHNITATPLRTPKVQR